MRRAAPLVSALIFAAAGMSSGPAWAREMRMMESLPAAHARIDGHGSRFFVRFDGPVDHAQSRLEIVRGGKTVAVLHTRLNSSPDTLYAEAPRLSPGDYELRWLVRGRGEPEASSGAVPFSVAP